MDSKKIKVCWISNAPAPYKVAFMNFLGEKVDLYCLFETKAEGDREKGWYDYKFKSFHAVFLEDADAKKEIKKLARECDYLINSDYTKTICMYAVREFHKQKKKTFMHADGGLAVSRGLLDKGISLVMKQNDYFISSGDETNKYFLHYGISLDKIRQYHFACMHDYELNSNRIYRNKQEECKKKCGFKEDTILLSVGQQIPRKGYDILAKAMINVSKDVGLYIVGGKPEENVLKIIEENKLDNIHFISFKTKEELRDYYAGADLFIFPTRYDIWGLVINEAMSFGLPILSTNKCVAAVEFNSKYHNAKIVEAENIEELRDAINNLVKDSEKRQELGENSLKGIQDYSLENMVKDFVRILEE